MGNIICATAHSMNVFIGGMVFNGVGAGINEVELSLYAYSQSLLTLFQAHRAGCYI